MPLHTAVVAASETPIHARLTDDMSTIPDFNDSEMWTTQYTLNERYGREMELQIGDTNACLSLHMTGIILAG